MTILLFMIATFPYHQSRATGNLFMTSHQAYRWEITKINNPKKCNLLSIVSFIASGENKTVWKNTTHIYVHTRGREGNSISECTHSPTGHLGGLTNQMP